MCAFNENRNSSRYQKIRYFIHCVVFFHFLSPRSIVDSISDYESNRLSRVSRRLVPRFDLHSWGFSKRACSRLVHGVYLPVDVLVFSHVFALLDRGRWWGEIPRVFTAARTFRVFEIATKQKDVTQRARVSVVRNTYAIRFKREISRTTTRHYQQV